MLFQNRRDAGQQLARALSKYTGDPAAIVLALPRGGVPVGYEVARALGVPLGVFVVRKLGVPGCEELAMGAIASGGIRVLNGEVIESFGIRPADIEAVTLREHEELLRRERAYVGDRPPLDPHGRTVILVDDGVATGMTMVAAIRAVKARDPERIVVAVPVTSPDTCESLGRLVDDIVCLRTPEPFMGVGRWYVDFSPTGDQEVRDLLHRHLTTHTTAPAVDG